MKILMLTPYLPYPPASGGQIRTLNLLKYLSQENEITLIALYKNSKEKQYAKYLETYCKKIYLCKRAEKPWQIKNILKSIFTPLPFLIVRNFPLKPKKPLKNYCEKQNSMSYMPKLFISCRISPTQPFLFFCSSKR